MVAASVDALGWEIELFYRVGFVDENEIVEGVTPLLGFAVAAFYNNGLGA